MINEAAGVEWTYAGVPGTSFVDGWDRDYAHSYRFDLTANALPSDYPPQ
jgi:hypothetical protein